MHLQSFFPSFLSGQNFLLELQFQHQVPLVGVFNCRYPNKILLANLLYTTKLLFKTLPFGYARHSIYSSLPSQNNPLSWSVLEYFHPNHFLSRLDTYNWYYCNINWEPHLLLMQNEVEWMFDWWLTRSPVSHEDSVILLILPCMVITT